MGRASPNPYADHIVGAHRYERHEHCPVCNPEHPDHQKVVMIEEEWDRAERDEFESPA